VLTGELRNQIDGIWNDFWSGGLSMSTDVKRSGAISPKRSRCSGFTRPAR
jgi:hypothetical protein